MWRGYAVRHITFDIEDALWRKKRPKQAKHGHVEGHVDMMEDFEYEEFDESEVEWLLWADWDVVFTEACNWGADPFPEGEPIRGRNSNNLHCPRDTGGAHEARARSRR